MQGPLVSAIIGHYDRDHALARLLRCLHRQTYDNLEILVTADGSPPHGPFLWWGKPVLLPDLIEQEKWDKVRWIDFERQENALKQVAKCMNVAARLTKGEMLLMLNNDWWLEDAWLEKMVASLVALGKENHIVGVQKGRRHMLMGGWPFEAHVAPLPFPAYIDCGCTNLLWRDDWIDLDESLDGADFVHQWPLWGFVLQHAGHRLWYNSTVIMKHVHPERQLHSYLYSLGEEKAAAMYEKSVALYLELRAAIEADNYPVTRLKDEADKEQDETVSEHHHRPLQP